MPACQWEAMDLSTPSLHTHGRLYIVRVTCQSGPSHADTTQCYTGERPRATLNAWHRARQIHRTLMYGQHGRCVPRVCWLRAPLLCVHSLNCVRRNRMPQCRPRPAHAHAQQPPLASLSLHVRAHPASSEYTHLQHQWSHRAPRRLHHTSHGAWVVLRVARVPEPLHGPRTPDINGGIGQLQRAVHAALKLGAMPSACLANTAAR